ncbi:MAG TPA: hypothetical protein VFV90_07655 [Usitatibacter sp.]|nr:hypothetical protein [Usitatibacter sp.]
MDRAKIGAAALIALGVGFIVGFAWGQGTRDATGGATTADFSGGVLTVRVAVTQALRQGLENLLR